VIGRLPKELTVGGINYKINSDFRQSFNIMQIFERKDLSDGEKLVVMIGILFDDDISLEHQDEAIDKAFWFLDGGDTAHKKGGTDYGKLYSWEQDAQYIIAAVNLTLGMSCRGTEYLHWWDFTAALMECKECTFSTLVHQRKLKKQGKQSKVDKEWWAENKEIAELKTSFILTAEEQAALDKFDNLLG
jgi:hypothetical protein